MNKEILSLLMCLIIIYFIKDVATAIIIVCVLSIMLNIIFGKSPVNTNTDIYNS
jgi:hypothetical protein